MKKQKKCLKKEIQMRISYVFFVVTLISCTKSYRLENNNDRDFYYIIEMTDKKHMNIELYMKKKLYFDYKLIREGDSFVFLGKDKLDNEKGKFFLSKNNNSRLYSYLIDLKGNAIYDSLITKPLSKNLYITLIKDFRKGYSSTYRIFYYDENFKIDSIYESSDIGLTVYK